MANDKLSGRNLNLFRNSGTDLAPVWKLIACLTDTSLAGETEILEANSKCGADSLPGITAWTADFTGFAAIDLGAGTESFNEVVDLFQNQEVTSFIITDDVTTPTVWRGFKGFISSYNEEYNFSGVVGFSGSINIKGEVDTTLPA